MRAVKELGYPLKKNVRLVLGSDEECGSSDLEYYYKKEVEAPCTFSPDAEFPVINIEKGGMRGHFEKTSDAGTTGVRLVSLQAGTKLNVVPGKAYAELAGMAKEDLKTCADETEQKTGVSFVLEDTENGNIKITACGAFAHASTPEMGNNALTALLQLLASVGMEESELKNDISFLAKVYPHGDGKGAGLGVAMSDEESGELTLSLDLMNYDGKTLTGSYDCRAPICATKENLYDTAGQNMKKGGFSMEGSGMFPPHHVPADSPFVQTLLQCYTDPYSFPELLSPDYPCRIQSIHPRHHNIHINHPEIIQCGFPEDFNCFLSVRCTGNLHTTVFQYTSGNFHVQHIVFHNQCPHAFYRIIIKAYWLI